MNFQTPAQRALARQNLLNAAVNVAIKRGLVDLEAAAFETAVFDFEVAGRPAVGCIRDNGDEITVHAIVDPTEFARRFACCCISTRRPRFGSAIAIGWLDLGSGQFINVTRDYLGSNEVTPLLAGLRCCGRLTA